MQINPLFVYGESNGFLDYKINFLSILNSVQRNQNFSSIIIILWYEMEFKKHFFKTNTILKKQVGRLLLSIQSALMENQEQLDV